ncbi:hypothetical protein CEXT_74561 [Caerostris extrusa]|uniref:Uncharacterized protein n=1 Tax=Caerostris extrusa TaxID=172846 RepID=A0AAV4T5R3_CAEEX|nr:hypothetical protein CEXT_74561 [Caerostris extrusa]
MTFNVHHFESPNHLLRPIPQRTGDVPTCLPSRKTSSPPTAKWKGTEPGARESLILMNKDLIPTLHKRSVSRNARMAGACMAGDT